MDTHAPVSRRAVIAAAAAGGVSGLAGCLGGNGNTQDRFVFAAVVLDDPADIEREYGPLAEWIEDRTDVPTRIDPMRGNSAAIGALAAGQAQAAYLSGGPAWVGWQQHGLEPLAVEVDEDGRTSYTAGAWTTADSGIDTVEDLAGRDSCHTGDLAGAGMLIPTAHLAHEGLVSFEPNDDVTAIRDAVEGYFGNPVVGGGYVGALRCLSSGRGEVAFVRKSTPADYCGGDDAPSWCLPLDEYELLAEFAEVPSHPIMGSPSLDDDAREALQSALMALNDDPTGREILEEVLGTYGLTTASSAEHLGPYGELIEVLPGIEDHLVE